MWASEYLGVVRKNEKENLHNWTTYKNPFTLKSMTFHVEEIHIRYSISTRQLVLSTG